MEMIDLRKHPYRVFDRNGVLIGHLSTAYAAASHLYLHAKATRMPGGRVECPDGRTIDYRECYDLHARGVLLEQARLAAISNGGFPVPESVSTEEIFAGVRAAVN